MYAYTFKRGAETIQIPAETLQAATSLLPIHWRIGHLTGFSVTARPITDDADYYKVRCAQLEFQLAQLLRTTDGASQRHH